MNIHALAPLSCGIGRRWRSTDKPELGAIPWIGHRLASSSRFPLKFAYVRRHRRGTWLKRSVGTRGVEGKQEATCELIFPFFPPQRARRFDALPSPSKERSWSSDSCVDTRRKRFLGRSKAEARHRWRGSPINSGEFGGKGATSDPTSGMRR